MTILESILLQVVTEYMKYKMKFQEINQEVHPLLNELSGLLT